MEPGWYPRESLNEGADFEDPELGKVIPYGIMTWET